RAGAASDRVAMGAVGADQVVLGTHHRGRADDRGLLADREGQETAGLRALVLAPGLLLEAADQRHRREQLPAGVGIGDTTLAAAVAGRGALPVRGRGGWGGCAASQMWGWSGSRSIPSSCSMY